jgi:hypothetical protein
MKPHPHAGEEWFERLPLERQVEMARKHRQGLERVQELERLEKRRMWIESLRMGAVFAVGDWLSPFGGLASCALAVVVGTLTGFACHRLDALRLRTALIGGLSFLLVELLLRGGMSLTQIVISFPISSACALIGYTREERGML